MGLFEGGEKRSKRWSIVGTYIIYSGGVRALNRQSAGVNRERALEMQRFRL